MGVNYYLHLKDNHSLHIGKSSSGWRFCFRGYRDQEQLIESYQAWRVLILDALAKGCRLCDEHGNALSAQQFFYLVGTKTTDPMDYVTYCLASPYACVRRHGQQECWRDREGHPFCETEYS